MLSFVLASFWVGFFDTTPLGRVVKAFNLVPGSFDVDKVLEGFVPKVFAGPELVRLLENEVRVVSVKGSVVALTLDVSGEAVWEVVCGDEIVDDVLKIYADEEDESAKVDEADWAVVDSFVCAVESVDWIRTLVSYIVVVVDDGEGDVAELVGMAVDVFDQVDDLVDDLDVCAFKFLADSVNNNERIRNLKFIFIKFGFFFINQL